MSASTNAILAYGFDLGEELPDSLMTGNEDYFCFDEWFRANLFKEPEPDFDTQLEDWRAWTARANQARDAYPIDIVTHCSGSYLMYFLCIRGTVLTATRGEPEVIDERLMVPDIDAKTAALAGFCAEHGIDSQRLRWHLFSYWSS